MISIRKLPVPNLAPTLPIFDVERCIKLISDLSTDIETHHKNACNTSYDESFKPEILRQKALFLEEIMNFFSCFHTVDYLNIEYGKKCEEKLWKTYFYQNYRLFKVHHSKASEDEVKKFKLFLISGLGTYYSLIFNLQATFNLKELNFVSYFRSMPLKANLYLTSEDYMFSNGLDSKQYDFGRNQKNEFKSLLIHLFGRFFTCVGDLSRYLIDCFPDDKARPYYHENAVFFYKCASIIEPSNGMPYNQLGTLLRDHCHSLNSLYYYFRSLKSKSPFVMSASNINCVFHALKNIDSKRYLSIKTKEQFTERAVHAFLSFYAFVHQARSASKFRFGTEYSVMMKSTVEKIAKIISIQKPKSNYSKQNPDHLTADNLMQMVSLVFILIDELRKDMAVKKIDCDFKKLSKMALTPNDKIPFLMNILIQFLFELLNVLLCHEKKRLENALPSVPAYEETRQALAREISQIDSFQFKKDSSKKNKFRSDYSFSSDLVFEEDTQAINSLKSTAINSIVDLFDHPEVDNDLDQFSAIDEDEDEEESHGSSASDQAKNLLIPQDVRNAISLLDSLYINSFTSVIKMFCDLIESNSYLLTYGASCEQFHKFLPLFYDYMNLLSEFDYKLITGFNHLFCSVPPHLKTEGWISYDSFVLEQRKIAVANFVPEFPPGILSEYLNLSNSTQLYYENKYRLDNPDRLDEFYKHISHCSTQELSHRCMRSLLLFAHDYCTKWQPNAVLVFCEHSNHQFHERSPMSFIVSPMVKASRMLKIQDFSMFESLQKQMDLLSLSQECVSPVELDASDLEVENISNSSNSKISKLKKNYSEKTFKVLKKGDDFKFSCSPKPAQKEKLPFGRSASSFVDLSNHNFMLIEPFVYIENLNFVKKIAKNRKAFIIVPKLVVTFLQNLKNKNHPKGTIASEYLTDEFIKGSRIFQFIRTEDRLPLGLASYPDLTWNRDLPTNLENGHATENLKVQDQALYYELLEVCNYLLVNKVLDNRCDEKPTEMKIALITNDLSKWPSNAVQFAKPFKIDVMSIENYNMMESTKKETHKNRGPTKRFNNARQFTSSPNRGDSFVQARTAFRAAFQKT